MSGKTGIDWTGATWNYLPWRCRPVSAGCQHYEGGELAGGR
jgi:protein gp37